MMDSIGLNTRGLSKKGWRGRYFDANFESREFNISQAILTEDSIGRDFESHGIPKDCDYVSIDVDSIDLWLLKGLLDYGYRPRVISVEFNWRFPPDALITMPRQW